MTYRPGVMAPGFPLLREDEIINFEPPFPTRRSAISTAVRERPAWGIGVSQQTMVMVVILLGSAAACLSSFTPKQGRVFL